jgi:hypothetical protein
MGFELFTEVTVHLKNARLMDIRYTELCNINVTVQALRDTSQIYLTAYEIVSGSL